MAFEIEVVRRRISDFLDRGKNDADLIGAISNSIDFCPIECELVDYKESSFGDAISLAKGIKHIVALHNTYGGYLILGVQETESEKRFSLKGFDASILDIKKIKDKIFSYTGSHIQISSYEFSIQGVMGASIYIPKRLPGVKPTAFGKYGPTTDRNEHVFQPGDVVFRSGDNTRPARGDEFEFLYGTRLNPYVDAIRLFDRFSELADPLPNNLPDRNFVCPKFIGRTEILRELWTWLADRFSFARVLAGEGGLGKTSMAYEFCENVCRASPDSLDRIVWVTAKKRQFSGDKNNYVGVPTTHYETYKDLLEVLCLECAIQEEEVEGADESLLQSFLREGVAIVPTLFVIDDVDSLSLNDQKRVMELAWQFGSKGSRFLLTTRRSLSFSTDLTIDLKGLEGKEFLDYMDTLRDRYKGPVLTDSEMRTLEEVTKGSPLFTESLYRLIRRGLSFSVAIKEWKGKSGNEVRAAALKREIEDLPEEARRVLFAASILRNCSRTELEQATGYVGETISDALDELSSLFLVYAPPISTEPRFEVSTATQSVIESIKTTLVPHHAKFEGDVRSLRRSNSELRSEKNNKIVASAVTEALAFIRASDLDGALKTVSAAQRKTKFHPDLYVLQARCYVSASPKRAKDARVSARKAFDAGSRKPLLFGLWYDAETSLEHWVGAVDVCSQALDGKAPPRTDWLLKRAAANFQLGNQQNTGSPELALRSYSRAADDISCTLDDKQPTTNWEVLHATHDAIFKLRDTMTGAHLLPALLDELLIAIKRGDLRWKIFERLVKTWALLYEDHIEKGEWRGELSQLLEARAPRIRLAFGRVISADGTGPFTKLYGSIKNSVASFEL